MELTFILLAILGANLFVLLLNIVFWLLVSRVDIKVRKRKQEINEEYNNIISNANQKAAGIIEQANNKASKLLEKTEFQIEDLRESARKNYAQTQEKHLQQLQIYLNDLKSEDQQFIGQLKESLSKEAKQLAINSLTEVLSTMEQIVAEFKGNIGQTQEQATQKINEAIDDTKQEIKNYKQHQIELVDKSIINLVKHVTLKVIGKSINPNEHQQLIIESLESAKKEGVI